MRNRLNDLRIDFTDQKELDAAKQAAIDFWDEAHMAQVKLEVSWEIEDKFEAHIQEISNAF